MEAPVGELKTVRVDLPVGLSVNPGATAALHARDLRSRSQRLPRRLESRRKLVTAPVPGGPIAADRRVTQVPVYNVEPETG